MELLFLFVKDYANLKDAQLNFGGEFIFELGSDHFLEAKKNENYIPNFFNSIEGNGSNLLNVTALVGQNGSGKSVWLDFILSELKLYSETPYEMLAVLQNTGSKELIILHSLKDVNYDQLKVVINRPIQVVRKQLHERRIVNKDTNSLIKPSDLSIIFFSNIFDASLFEKDVRNIDSLKKLGIFDISTNYLIKKDVIVRTATNRYRSRDNVRHHREADFFRQYDLLTNMDLRKRFINFQLPSDVTMEPISLDVDWVLNQLKLEKIDESIILFIKNVNNSSSNENNENVMRKTKNFSLTVLNTCFYAMFRELLASKEELVKKSIITCFNIELQTEEKNRVSFNVYSILERFKHYFDHESSVSQGKTKSTFNFLSNVFHHSLKLLEIIQLMPKSDDNKNFTFKIDTPYESHESFIRFWNHYRRLNDIVPFCGLNWGNISTGQKAFLNIFARFYSLLKESLSKNILILIDEGDMYFHPQWQKCFVRDILEYLTHIFNDKNIQIILTSHSPFVLSDLPQNNVILLNYEDDKNESLTNESIPTFAGNFHTLFTNSFFITNGLIGEYAKEKINQVIKFLQSGRKDPEFLHYSKALINLIGEPVIRNKLSQMLFEYLEKINEKDTYGIEIQLLENRLKELKEERERERLLKKREVKDDKN